MTGKTNSTSKPYKGELVQVNDRERSAHNYPARESQTCRIRHDVHMHMHVKIRCTPKKEGLLFLFSPVRCTLYSCHRFPFTNPINGPRKHNSSWRAMNPFRLILAYVKDSPPYVLTISRNVSDELTDFALFARLHARDHAEGSFWD